MFVIGPDYLFSAIELGLANLITLGVVFVPAVRSSNWMVLLGGLLTLSLQNVSFLLTVCMNQGLPPRNPSTHSKTYLSRVKT